MVHTYRRASSVSVLLALACAAIAIAACGGRADIREPAVVPEPEPKSFASSLPGALAVAEPGRDEASRIELQLRGQTALVPVEDRLPMFVTVRFPPRPGLVGDLRLLVQPTSRLDSAGLVPDPRTVLEGAGLYLGVTRADGRFVWITRIADPRYVYAEYLTKAGMTGYGFADASGVISTRVPFDPGGSLKLFTVGPTGRVTDVHLAEPILTSLIRAQPYSAGYIPISVLARNLMTMMFQRIYSTLFIYFFADRPALYRVAGNADPDTAINVLILGDGFLRNATRNDLPSYRAAVERLVDRVLLQPPYCHYTDEFNFYRIDVADVVDPAAGALPIVSDNCPSTCAGAYLPVPSHSSFVELTSPSVVAGQGVLEQDLELTRCYTISGVTGRCRILWTPEDGQQKIANLIGAYPEVPLKIAVLLGNIDDWVGAGLFDTIQLTPSQGSSNQSSFRLAALGVPVWNFGGILDLEPDAANLFDHELSHTIGLVDEYPEGGLHPSITPPIDRNVWLTGKSLPWATATEGTSDPIPWAGLLSGCSVEDRVACCGMSPCDPADLCSGVPDPPDCCYVPTICNQDQGTVCNNAEPETKDACIPPDSICPGMTDPENEACNHDVCNAKVSLLEGALYDYVKNYRASNSCRMNEIGDKFCDACLLSLGDRIHQEFGLPHLGLPQLKQPCPKMAIFVDVRDSMGAPLSLAVKLERASLSRSATANALGKFMMNLVPPGTYRLTAELEGFSPINAEVTIPGFDVEKEIAAADGTTISIAVRRRDPF